MDVSNGSAYATATASVIERYGIEVNVIGYPPHPAGAPVADSPFISDDDQPWAQLVGPWHTDLEVNNSGARVGPQTLWAGLHRSKSEQLGLVLENVHRAQHGWLAGRMQLLASSGEVLGSMRPFLLYARESSLATYTYFADTHPAIGGAFSVGLRVTREP